MDGDARLRLFVYGTLKRGFGNHRKLCQGVRSVEEAEIRGKLYALPVGYPALVIPRANILSIGTADAAADVTTQYRLQAEPDGASRNTAGSPSGWDRVRGEILTFDDAPRRLPKFDRLENFRPKRHSSYLRALAQVFPQRSHAPVVSWVYVMSDPGPRATRLRSGRWPE
jgi:gamma-glutamylcyclotransferase (GGCT)/AIG2-like uncharacterized protein YtfP